MFNSHDQSEQQPQRFVRLEKPPNSTLHLLPLVINYEGTAQISAYLRNMEQIAFRGRVLEKSNIPLPEGYVGILCEPSKTQQEAQVWQVKEEFQSLTIWDEQDATNGHLRDYQDLMEFISLSHQLAEL